MVFNELEMLIEHTEDIIETFQQDQFETNDEIIQDVQMRGRFPQYSFEEEIITGDGLRDILTIDYTTKKDDPKGDPIYTFTMSLTKGQKRSYDYFDILREEQSFDFQRIGEEDKSTKALVELFRKDVIPTDLEGRKYVVSENGEQVIFRYETEGDSKSFTMKTSENGHMTVTRDLINQVYSHTASFDTFHEKGDGAFGNRDFNEEDIIVIGDHFVSLCDLVYIVVSLGTSYLQ